MGDGIHKSTVFRRCLNILDFMRRIIIFLMFLESVFPLCENASSGGTSAGSSDASGNLKVYLYFRQIYYLSN